MKHNLKKNHSKKFEENKIPFGGSLGASIEFQGDEILKEEKLEEVMIQESGLAVYQTKKVMLLENILVKLTRIEE